MGLKKRNKFLVFVTLLLFFICFNNQIVEASENGNIEYIEVERKNVLTSEHQIYKVKLKDDYSVTNLQMSYKRPDGWYSAVQLFKNSAGEYEGRSSTYPAGNYEVAHILVNKRDGFALYEDISEGGQYELDEGNFTAHSSDTAGPILDDFYVDKPIVLYDGTVTVTVQAHDELSDIQQMYLDYKTPNGYYQLPATSIGNGQYEVVIPSFMTSGWYYAGKIECVGITMIDTYNNRTAYYDYDYYSSRDLSAGDFTIKPEVDAPLLKNIYVDKNEVTSQDSLKILAEVEDASGVKDVKVNFSSPAGYNFTTVLTHIHGNTYEGEIPSYYTSLDTGNWAVQFVWINDIYDNSLYIWSNDRYWWGEDLTGGNFIVKERDITMPERPNVYDIYDSSTTISGWSEPYARIDVYADGVFLDSTTVYSSSYFYVTIPAQKAGTNIVISATDASGNTSEQVNLVVKDGTPPPIPEVNQVSDQDTSISGQAEPYAIVSVTAYDTFINSTTADSEGKFKMEMPLQIAGTELFVSASDASGNMGEAQKITVIDATPPAMPTVYGVTEYDESIFVMAEVGSSIKAIINGKVFSTISMDGYVYYWINIPRQTPGTRILITSTDASGNESEAAEVIVQDTTAPTGLTVEAVTDKSTEVRGKAETDAVVSVTAGTSVLGSEKAIDGQYSVEIPKQKAGTKIQVTATDKAGNISEVNEVTVSDVTAPSFSGIEEVTDFSTAVTGITEVASTVVLRKGKETIGTVVSDKKGRFTIQIPMQKAGIKLTIMATDSAGNVSEIKEINVKDITAPDISSVDEVTDKSLKVTGKAEAGSLVTVKAGSTVIAKGNSTATGDFSINIPAQKAGTKLFLTAVDAAGNISEAKAVTVKDVTAPSNPSVDKVTDKSTTITGTTEADAKIVVIKGSTNLSMATANKAGNYVVTIPKQKVGTKLVVTATDSAGNISGTVEIIVIDETAPALPNVNEVTEKSEAVTGTAEIGSIIKVQDELKVLGTVRVNAEGKFSLAISKQQSGKKLFITATDAVGNVSAARQVIVKDVTAPSIPLVNGLDDNDNVISGKAESGAKVIAAVGKKTIGEAIVANGAYSIKIAKQPANTTVEVYAIDQAGNKSAKKTMKVIDKTAPAVPTVNAVGDNSIAVSGKAETGAKVYAYVGKKKLGEVTAKSGAYSLKIAKQKAGTSISVYAIDPAKNKSGSKTIKVVDKTAPAAPTVNKITSKSTTVSGKGEKATTILIYNGSKKIGQGTVDSKGNFKVKIKAQKKGSSLIFYVQDKAKNKSKSKSVKVS